MQMEPGDRAARQRLLALVEQQALLARDGMEKAPELLPCAVTQGLPCRRCDQCPRER